LFADPAVKRFYVGELEERLAYLYFVRSQGHAVTDKELLDLKTEIFSLDPESEALEVFYELRALLAFLDSPNEGPRALKQLLGQVNHVSVRMWPELNHPRPHFHVKRKNEYSASYALDTLERLAGKMPRKIEKIILGWAAREQQTLLDIWKGLQAGEDVRSLITGLSPV
jgi:Domain of unknown function (DUF4160)